jgi:hypothetical protein
LPKKVTKKSSLDLSRSEKIHFEMILQK